MSAEADSRRAALRAPAIPVEPLLPVRCDIREPTLLEEELPLFACRPEPCPMRAADAADAARADDRLNRMLAASTHATNASNDAVPRTSVLSGPPTS